MDILLYKKDDTHLDELHHMYICKVFRTEAVFSIFCRRFGP